MKLNKAPLLKVKEIILKYPERYDQDYYSIITDCGTAHCISGWLHETIGAFSDSYSHEIIGVPLTSLVKLRGHTSSGTVHWPPKYRDAYLNAKTAKGRARVGARMIDYFIKMNGEI